MECKYKDIPYKYESCTMEKMLESVDRANDCPHCLDTLLFGIFILNKMGARVSVHRHEDKYIFVDHDEVLPEKERMSRFKKMKNNALKWMKSIIEDLDEEEST